MTVDYSALAFTDIIAEFSPEASFLLITFNRTSQRNTFNRNFCQELIRVFDLADRDDRVRVVVVTADPKAGAFCAGADLDKGWDGLWTAEAEKEGLRAHRDGGGMLNLAVLRCRKVTIIAVNGHAAGIGMTMQLSFDFRFVWEGAKLAFPFVRRGIAAEALSSYLLPRLIGYSLASQLLLSGKTLPASHPLLSSLYYSTLPSREDVLPAALAFATEIAKNTSAPAIAMTKMLMWRGSGMGSPEEQHILESRTIRTLGQSRDGAEGVKSFMEKRKPEFKGTLGEDLPDWVPWWNEVSTVPRKAKL